MKGARARRGVDDSRRLPWTGALGCAHAQEENGSDSREKEPRKGEGQGSAPRVITCKGHVWGNCGGKGDPGDP